MDETLILAIVSIVTLGLLGGLAVWRTSGDTRQAITEGGRISLRNAIANPALSTAIEARLTALPPAILDSVNRVLDVFDPLTDATVDTLDNDTKQWLKNLTDSNPDTGAITS